MYLSYSSHTAVLGHNTEGVQAFDALGGFALLLQVAETADDAFLRKLAFVLRQIASQEAASVVAPRLVALEAPVKFGRLFSRPNLDLREKILDLFIALLEVPELRSSVRAQLASIQFTNSLAEIQAAAQATPEAQEENQDLLPRIAQVQAQLSA